jgi:peptide/nickel transport system permease protein
LGRYIAKKAIYTFITLFGVVSVIFYLFNVLPGDPARMMLGQNEDEEQLKIVQKKYGFDQPIFTQYLYYLNDLSPVSLHSNSKDHYTQLSSNKYKYVKLIGTPNNQLVLKFPYLRTSFTRQGMSVSQILKGYVAQYLCFGQLVYFYCLDFGNIFGYTLGLV